MSVFFLLASMASHIMTTILLSISETFRKIISLSELFADDAMIGLQTTVQLQTKAMCVTDVTTDSARAFLVQAGNPSATAEPNSAPQETCFFYQSHSEHGNKSFSGISHCTLI